MLHGERMELTIDDGAKLLDVCRRLVPGGTFTFEGEDATPFTVRYGAATVHVWWWTGNDEANWSFKLCRDGEDSPEDESYLEGIEDLTAVLFSAFGPVVLPAVLVAVLAADAQEFDAPRIMDAAFAVLAEPRCGEFIDPADKRYGLREALIGALEARGVPVWTRLVLFATALVAPTLGVGWHRPALAVTSWDGEDAGHYG